LEAVKAAECLNVLPDSVAKALTNTDAAGGKNKFECNPASDDRLAKNNFGECALGDPHGTKLMVIYGDSRAHMWAGSLEGVAARTGWKLRVFSMGACPVLDLNFLNVDTKVPFRECDGYHKNATAAIRALHPDLVIATSITGAVPLADGSNPTSAQWQEGWTSTFKELAQPGTRFALIGSIPWWKQLVGGGSRCLAAHPNAVQECAALVADATPQDLDAEKAAANVAGATYIPTVPWICADRCEPVIAGIRVYGEGRHVTQSYAVYLSGALGEALMPVLM
jgi:hypothetical protein